MDLVFVKEKFSILLYMYPTVALLGLIGNLLAFIVFGKPVYKTTVFSTFYRFLAFANTFALLRGVYIFLVFNFDMQMIDKWSFLSTTIPFLVYSMPCLAMWALCAIAVETFRQLIVKTTPKKNAYQLVICLLLLLVNISYYGHIFFRFINKFKLLNLFLK